MTRSTRDLREFTRAWYIYANFPLREIIFFIYGMIKNHLAISCLHWSEISGIAPELRS